MCPARRKPEWLKQPLPDAGAQQRMTSLLRRGGLHTVCESASCPNMGTCFAHGTATFLIMGDVCTRSCRFCGVDSGTPGDLDQEEPARLTDAAAELGLRHVVVTSVTRDDLADGGAAHYVATIAAIRGRLPGATVEVLVPDFAGHEESLDTVLAAGPEVLNHNVETVRRLCGDVRPQADYDRSLGVLRYAVSRGGHAVKTGFMVGLGERPDEIEDLMVDIGDAGVDMVTIGQYLQPTRESLPVARYVPPEEFERYVAIGESLGLVVQGGPFVRSSFWAGESFEKVKQRGGKSSGVELQ